MKQLVITRHGPPEVLAVRQAPEPAVASGMVRIRVRAAGVNFSDLLARQGLYPDAPKPPCVMGYEVSGVVDAKGEDVDTPAIGDRVLALCRFGGQSELVVVPASSVFAIPAGWSFEQAAAFPVVYLTAHHLLDRVCAVRRGETILVQAAAGGVGIAVAQLGKILGLRVLGLASPGKHEVLRTLGVVPLDGRDPRWPDAVRKLAPRGVDVALDSVGGSSWRHSYSLLAPLGRLVCYGVSDLSTSPRSNLLSALWKILRWPRFAPASLMNDNRTVAGVNLGHLWDAEAIIRPQMESLLALARDGLVSPLVDRSFPLESAADAHRYLHERRNIGKVVLTLA